LYLETCVSRLLEHYLHMIIVSDEEHIEYPQW